MITLRLHGFSPRWVVSAVLVVFACSLVAGQDAQAQRRGLEDPDPPRLPTFVDEAAEDPSPPSEEPERLAEEPERLAEEPEPPVEEPEPPVEEPEPAVEEPAISPKESIPREVNCAPPILSDPDPVVTKRIDALLESKYLAGGRVGVLAVAYPEGTLLYARNPHDMFNPASVTKVFTAAAILWKLGGNHRFVTTVWRTPGDCPDLYIKGMGDPGLTHRGIRSLAADVKKSGITCVGTVFVDRRPMDKQILPPAYEQKRTDAAYRAKVGSIGINNGTFGIRVKPGSGRSSPPEVELIPPCSAFVVDNRAVTVDELSGDLSGLKRTVSEYKGKVVVQLSGEVVRSQPQGLTDSMALPDPNRFSAFLFLDALVAGGIKVKVPEPGTRKTPADAQEVASLSSRPLRDDVREMMQWSRNFMAEQMFKGLSAGLCRVFSFDCGRRRLLDAFPRFGVPASCVRLTNGSGLYDANRISPALTVRFLVEALSLGTISSDFLASFPRSGVSGTLKDRMGRVKSPVLAKTGTLDGVSSLAGYLQRSGGGMVVFAIYFDGTRASAWNLRRLQDRMVEVLDSWGGRR